MRAPLLTTSRTEEASTSEGLARVVIWNIRNGGGRRTRGIVEALASLEADVVVICEYTTPLGRALIDGLYEVGLREILHTEPPGERSGVLVASRHPLLLGSIEAAPIPDRFLHVRCENLDLEIAAVHLPSGARDVREHQVFWEWLLAVSETLLARPAMIAGDLNSAAWEWHEDGHIVLADAGLTRLFSRGWRDRWRDENPYGSVSSWWTHSGHGVRIDHLLASPGLVPRLSKTRYVTAVDGVCLVHERRVGDGCGRRALSDHAALVVEAKIERGVVDV